MYATKFIPLIYTQIPDSLIMIIRRQYESTNTNHQTYRYLLINNLTEQTMDSSLCVSNMAHCRQMFCQITPLKWIIMQVFICVNNWLINHSSFYSPCVWCLLSGDVWYHTAFDTAGMTSSRGPSPSVSPDKDWHPSAPLQDTHLEIPPKISVVWKHLAAR